MYMVAETVVMWNDCLEIIKEDVDEQTFRTWFEPIKPLKLEDNILTIQVPNKFFYRWLEEHFIGVLRKAIINVFGPKGKLEYYFIVDDHKKKSHSTNENGLSGNQIKNPFVIPGIKKFKIESNLKSNYIFENFIEGDCNKLARSAGMNIAQKPGNNPFNPLVIYGDVGVGKTHLAHAIGNEVKSNFDKSNVVYVSSDEFTSQVINAIKQNTLEDCLNYYKMVDVLIIDDIQFLANRTKTQEIFFNLFNELRSGNRQIILTSDRPPKNMDGMEDRIINRLKWGLIADISNPEFETRMAILQGKIEEHGEQIPMEVMEFICMNIKNNVRELEGVLISIIAEKTINNKDINIELAKEVIEKFVSKINKKITVENIKQLVADYFKLDIEELHAKSRKRPLVIARQLSMYLAKNYTKDTLKDIGRNFGNRDHSTVLHSLRQVQNMMDTEPQFKDQVTDLEKQVEMCLSN